jgi:phosphate transport system protein
MSELDVALGERCVELLKNTSLDEATQIADADDEVDKLHKQVFDIVLADDWKENAMFTVDVTLASRYFERFADHVVDISDKVRYLNTGDWTEN